jgi:peptidoglycan hydrolase FlgJ
MAIDNSLSIAGNGSAAASLAIDANSLNQLKNLSSQDPKQALKGAAQQFEALFMNMLMKSMRDATPQDGMFDSEQTRMFQGMLDQQMAQAMAKRGIGLAEVMVKQLSAGQIQDAARTAAMGAAGATGSLQAQSADLDNAVPLTPVPPSANAASLTAPVVSGAGSSSTREFADQMWPYAADASRATGIPAHFMLGQAALETGWGQRQLKGNDGTPSYNLFGVKAGRGWSGPTVSATTTEYVNGTAVKSTEKFRAYSSYAESFQDYAKMLQSNPRYAAVLQSGHDATGFAKGLQAAGYATDPQYADKLARIINGNVMRQSLSA